VEEGELKGKSMVEELTTTFIRLAVNTRAHRLEGNGRSEDTYV
jgi:hypothetical protein